MPCQDAQIVAKDHLFPRRMVPARAALLLALEFDLRGISPLEIHALAREHVIASSGLLLSVLAAAALVAIGYSVQQLVPR